ncbi:MAG TPA: rhomboid family intramembrane serine protease [Edaphocola sp.]|nr:rhomboid family intramembrane serine protease [Edaphocola sp.]
MHLILACAVMYILLQGVNVILIVLSPSPKTVFTQKVLPNIGLQDFRHFIHKPWVLLSYFWLHASFLNMLSNMLWLYCFGSVIQSFVGYKEVFPMFILSCLAAGLAFVGLSSFWPAIQGDVLLTSLPGVMAFAVGAFVLVPRYRFFLTEHFSVPIWLVVVIFIVLNVLTVSSRLPLLALLACAALFGALYIRLLRSGYKPGQILYSGGNKLQAMVTPEEAPGTKRMTAKREQTLKVGKHQVVEHPSQEYIDMLLDKINQKGYKSLTAEEKETLMNAGK